MLRATFLLTCALALSVSMPAQSGLRSTSGSTQAAATPAWEVAIQQRRKELIEKNGAGTDAALRDQLMKMRAEDQAARGFGGKVQNAASSKELMQKLPATDARLTAELKEIVAQKGWPTISLVGFDASNAAMLILTHTADHAWQRQLLPELQDLADAGKIDGAALALVVDKELVAEGKLQRYGSQFKFINGAMAMFAAEDPSHLDDRRAEALLPPMSVYKEMLSRMYNLKATDDVVMAPAPKK